MHKEKKEEKNSPAQMTVVIQGLAEYTKISKEKQIIVDHKIDVNTRTNSTTTKTKKQNGKKNNCTDTSSDKALETGWTGDQRKNGHLSDCSSVKIS